LAKWAEARASFRTVARRAAVAPPVRGALLALVALLKEQSAKLQARPSGFPQRLVPLIRRCMQRCRGARSPAVAPRALRCSSRAARRR